MQENKNEKINELENEMENDLEVIFATAVEDKLQPEVNLLFSIEIRLKKH